MAKFEPTAIPVVLQFLVDGQDPKTLEALRGPKGDKGESIQGPKGEKGEASTVPGPKGDKGEASMVPGPPGKDSRIPGPKGDPGEVPSGALLLFPAERDVPQGWKVVAWSPPAWWNALWLPNLPATLIRKE